jgi:hypothetical protein
MSNIKYSIIAPAIRSYWYRRFYDNINNGNPSPFEIIFVGDAPACGETLPENFKYIFTEVTNWTQCMEIAARNATGEYLLMAADDMIFSPGFMSRLEYYLPRFDMDKTFITFRYRQNDKGCDEALIFAKDVRNAPVIGVGGLFKREVWNSTGGLDRRFPGALAEIDMIYRFYGKGYSLFIPPDIWINEEVSRENQLYHHTMFGRTGIFGMKMLKKLWFKDNLFSKTRLDDVWMFEDPTILTEDQFAVDTRNMILPQIDLIIEPFDDFHKRAKLRISNGPSDDRDYLVEFVNLHDRRAMYSTKIKTNNETFCFLDFVRKFTVRVTTPQDGLLFQKTIKL